MNTTISPYTDLHRSQDKEGSVYGLLFRDQWSGSFHLDEHPFSCVWTIQSALYGTGSFGYIYFPLLDSQDNESWDYELLWRVLHNDTMAWNDHVGYVYANAGDMYCFYGNITIHTVNPVIGPSDRVVFVTAFSESEHFQHKDNVHEYNIWGQHRKDEV